mmetsp:Transcript_67915/g.113833  ORF Transcript_67915/g.113833 Transcript_67915/m.113833 type:complete len:97 (+) Transcript_67915:326-616(+)
MGLGGWQMANQSADPNLHPLKKTLPCCLLRLLALLHLSLGYNAAEGLTTPLHWNQGGPTAQLQRAQALSPFSSTRLPLLLHLPVPSGVVPAGHCPT